MLTNGFLTTKQVALKLGRPQSSVRRWCADGLFPGAALYGKTWLIPEKAIAGLALPKIGRPKKPRPQDAFPKRPRAENWRVSAQERREREQDES